MASNMIRSRGSPLSWPSMMVREWHVAMVSIIALFRSNNMLVISSWNLECPEDSKSYEKLLWLFPCMTVVMNLVLLSLFEPQHDKTNKMTMCPTKTENCLGIRQVWSGSSLSMWRKLGSLATIWAHSEDSDQTWRLPKLIRVFTGHTVILLVLSCRDSFIF